MTQETLIECRVMLNCGAGAQKYGQTKQKVNSWLLWAAQHKRPQLEQCDREQWELPPYEYRGGNRIHAVVGAIGQVGLGLVAHQVHVTKF